MDIPSTRCAKVWIGDVVPSIADLSEGDWTVKKNAHGF